VLFLADFLLKCGSLRYVVEVEKHGNCQDDGRPRSTLSFARANSSATGFAARRFLQKQRPAVVDEYRTIHCHKVFHRPHEIKSQSGQRFIGGTSPSAILGQVRTPKPRQKAY